MTPGGFARLKGELERLVDKERPELVATVSWAAGNGDRSENGDYIYGKKRLREIDRRIRFLIRRLDTRRGRRSDGSPATPTTSTRYSSAPRSTVRDSHGETRTVSIVGVDEIDTTRGYISWVSPMARALIKAREGDTVTLANAGRRRGAGDSRSALQVARHRMTLSAAPLTRSEA